MLPGSPRISPPRPCDESALHRLIPAVLVTLGLWLDAALASAGQVVSQQSISLRISGGAAGPRRAAPAIQG